MHPLNLQPHVEVKKAPNSALKAQQTREAARLGRSQEASASKHQVDAVEKRLLDKIKNSGAAHGASITPRPDANAQAARADVGNLKREMHGMEIALGQSQRRFNETINAVLAKIDAIDRGGQSTQRRIGALEKANKETISRLLAQNASLRARVERLEQRVASNFDQIDQLAEGVSGKDVILELDSAAEDVSAAALNAAAVGTLTMEFDCELIAQFTVGSETVEKKQRWAKFEPVTTLGNTGCWDPTIEWVDDPAATPAFNKGKLSIRTIFLTDGGSSYVYQPGDTVTVQIQVASDDKLHGGAMVSSVTKTYNVIA